jgi:hypothetical protein
MADTSNKFSLNALNRQKKLSGLYARRPEHIEEYFSIKAIPVPPTFVSVLSVNILNPGTNYANNMAVRFPAPQHPNGRRATGDLYLNITKGSFYISNAGSNHTVGSTFNIYSNLDNDLVGSITITSIGSNGSISDFAVTQFDPIKSGTLCVVDLENTNGSIIAIPEAGYEINSVRMTDYGSGYQTYSRTTGTAISHNIILYTNDNQYYYNTSEFGSGAQLQCDFNAIIKVYSKLDPRSREFYTDKNDNLIFSKDYLMNYNYLVKNYSLSDPTR